MEEDYRLFTQVKRNPINSCVDLSKNMRGKKNGIIYFTENFRMDFEKRMYKLTELEHNSISKDKIRDRQMQREFELQQEYKDFEDDVEWNVYQKLLKGSE